jgi:ribosomal protein L2
MKLIKLNPKTPGTRHQINLSKNLLAKNNFIAKNLTFNLQNFNGRSSDTGHITS